MWRVLNVVEQMSESVTAATSTLAEVLTLMDRQMFVLRSRLSSDTTLLRRGIEGSPLDSRDQLALMELLTKVEFSAARLGSFTQRDDVEYAAGSEGPSHVDDLLSERQAIDLMAILAYTHSPDAIIVADHQGVIRLVNPATELLTGYHSSELHGQSVDMLVPDSVRGHHASLRSGYFRAPNIRPMGLGLNLRIRQRDGRETPVDINLSPITLRGGAAAIITIRVLGSSSHGTTSPSSESPSVT